MKRPPQSTTDRTLRAEIDELRARLEEAEQTLRAIRAGEVDALVVEGDAGPQIFTLQGLDAEQNRFRGEMLGQVSDAVIAVDNEERITFLNAAAERRYGVSAGEVLGRIPSEIFSSHWPGPEAEAAMRTALSERGEWRGELIHRTHDGRELHVEKVVSTLCGPDGEGAGQIAAIRDVTQRKQLEQEKAETLRLLDTLLTHAPVGFLYLDRELRFVRINKRLAEMNGLSIAEHLGRTVAEILPTLEPTLREVTARILANGQPVLDHEFVGETVREPGVTRYWCESWYPVRDERGEIIGFGGVVEDITQRREAEAALRLSNERFDLAVKCSRAVLCQQDLELRYTWLHNPAPGIDGADAVGKKDADLLERAEDAAAIVALKREVIRTGLGLRREFSPQIKGVVHCFDVLLEPLWDAAGIIAGITGAAIDITELKRAEEARLEIERHFRALAEASAEISYRMSADWSTMLALDGRGFFASSVRPFADWAWVDQYLPGDEQDRVRQAINDAIARKHLFELEHRVLRLDGSIGWVRSRAVPLLDENGEVSTWFGAASDITERKATEEALRESEERLQKAISVQNVGVLFFKLDGQMLDANGALERMSGYTAEEMRRITDWAQLTPPEFMDVTRRAAAELAEHGVTDPYEKQWIRKDGSRFWGLFSPTRLSGSGSESECVEFTIDISETKRAEEQLRLHRQLLETTVNHLPAAVALIRGSDLTFQMVNPGYQAFAPGKQMTGKTIAEVWPEQMPLFGQRCGHVLETGEPILEVDERFEIRRDCEGPLETTYFTWSIRKVNLLDEVQPGLLITCWETTASKKAQEAVARLAAIVECSYDALLSEDLDGIVTSWNCGAEQIFGYSADEIIGTSILRLIPDAGHAAEHELQRQIVTGKRGGTIEATRKAKDGREFHALITVSPMRDAAGKIIGTSRVIRDITERKLAADHLREAKESAEAANAAKDRFLATLSHELRTPLTPVLLVSEVHAKSEKLAENLREDFEMIHRNIVLEAQLIDDLLDVSRIQQGKMRFNFKLVDVHEAIALALEMLHSEVEEKGIAVRQELLATPATLDADSARLRQVLCNLLRNAVKFTPRGGTITVHTARDQSTLQISVTDTGAGIAAEDVERIFQPFEQVDAQQQSEHQSLGLGLAISGAIISAHRGRIWAESAGPNQGTTFHVQLPC